MPLYPGAAAFWALRFSPFPAKVKPHASGLTHHQKCRGSHSGLVWRILFLFIFYFFYFHITSNTRLFRTASISLFFLPLTRVALLSTLLGALSTRSSYFPPGPAKPIFNNPPSHPNQLGRPTFKPGFAPENTTVYLSDGLLLFLLSAKNHALRSHESKVN